MLNKVEKPQRIVIYRLGSLGDTVIALPCFHKVAQTWPNAERIVLTNFPVSSKAAPLEVVLRESGLIHEAIAYPVGTRSIFRSSNVGLAPYRSRTAGGCFGIGPSGVLSIFRHQYGR